MRISNRDGFLDACIRRLSTTLEVKRLTLAFEDCSWGQRPILGGKTLAGGLWVAIEQPNRVDEAFNRLMIRIEKCIHMYSSISRI